MVSNTAMLATACILTAASYIIILSRLLLRRMKHEKYKADDSLMLFSMIFYAMNTTVSAMVAKFGSNTSIENASRLSQNQIDNAVIGSKAVLFGLPFYLSYVWSMKACILIYYTRLTSRTKELVAVKFTAMILLITWVSNNIQFFTECHPIQLAWQVVPETPYCAKAVNAIIAMGSTNIFTDVLIMLIPMPVILRAKLPLKTKIQLCAVFSVGFFVILISIMRIVIVLENMSEQNKLLWGQFECFSATVVANAPILYGLDRYRKVAKTTTRDRTRSFNDVEDTSLTTFTTNLSSGVKDIFSAPGYIQVPRPTMSRQNSQTTLQTTRTTSWHEFKFDNGDGTETMAKFGIERTVEINETSSIYSNPEQELRDNWRVRIQVYNGNRPNNL